MVDIVIRSWFLRVVVGGEYLLFLSCETYVSTSTLPKSPFRRKYYQFHYLVINLIYDLYDGLIVFSYI